MITAAAILQLVFDTVITTSATKVTETALKKGQDLWNALVQKFQHEPTVTTALAQAQQERSFSILEEQVSPFLQVEMIKDSNFATVLQTLATELQQSLKISEETIAMNANAYDQSTVKQVGKIEADTVNF